jgi:hypothetical protein
MLSAVLFEAHYMQIRILMLRISAGHCIQTQAHGHEQLLLWNQLFQNNMAVLCIMQPHKQQQPQQPPKQPQWQPLQPQQLSQQQQPPQPPKQQRQQPQQQRRQPLLPQPKQWLQQRVKQPHLQRGPAGSLYTKCNRTPPYPN